MKYSVIPIITTFVLASSCSWYRSAQRSVIDAEKQDGRTSNRPVSRAQYNELLAKYEDVSKKYEALKDNSNSEKSSLIDEIEKSKSENSASPSSNVETVNVFGEGQGNSVIATEAPKDLEGQLELYRKGLSMKSTNPGSATKIFQQLETSTNPPVRVRARFQVGELMFSQKQFDLALQVFEEIISKEAHSGVVLDALKFAVVCSDKLGLKNKKDQYSSMLNDIFEVKN